MKSKEQLFNIFIDKLNVEIPEILSYRGNIPSQYHFKDYTGFFIRDESLGVYEYDVDNKIYSYLYPIFELDLGLKNKLAFLFERTL